MTLPIDTDERNVLALDLLLSSYRGRPLPTFVDDTAAFGEAVKALRLADAFLAATAPPADLDEAPDPDPHGLLEYAIAFAPTVHIGNAIVPVYLMEEDDEAFRFQGQRAALLGLAGLEFDNPEEAFDELRRVEAEQEGNVALGAQLLAVRRQPETGAPRVGETLPSPEVCAAPKVAATPLRDRILAAIAEGYTEFVSCTYPECSGDRGHLANAIERLIANETAVAPGTCETCPREIFLKGQTRCADCIDRAPAAPLPAPSDVGPVPIAPGIARTVALLRSWGFNTTDSGDGVANVAAGVEGARDYPHVSMVVAVSRDLVPESMRLRSLLQDAGIAVVTHGLSRQPCIQATYDPANGVAILELHHVHDGMLPPATGDEMPF